MKDPARHSFTQPSTSPSLQIARYVAAPSSRYSPQPTYSSKSSLSRQNGVARSHSYDSGLSSHAKPTKPPTTTTTHRKNSIDSSRKVQSNVGIYKSLSNSYTNLSRNSLASSSSSSSTWWSGSSSSISANNENGSSSLDVYTSGLSALSSVLPPLNGNIPTYLIPKEQQKVQKINTRRTNYREYENEELDVEQEVLATPMSMSVLEKLPPIVKSPSVVIRKVEPAQLIRSDTSTTNDFVNSSAYQYQPKITTDLEAPPKEKIINKSRKTTFTAITGAGDLVTIVSGAGPHEQDEPLTSRIPLKLARQSGTLRHILDCCGPFLEGKTSQIVLPSVASDVLSQVVEYLELITGASVSGRSTSIEDMAVMKEGSTPDKREFTPQVETLLELMDTALYLGLPELVNICIEHTVGHFDALESFGDLPTSLIRAILKRLPINDLIHAERLLNNSTTAGRLDEVSSTSIWSSHFQQLFKSAHKDAYFTTTSTNSSSSTISNSIIIPLSLKICQSMRYTKQVCIEWWLSNCLSSLLDSFVTMECGNMSGQLEFEGCYDRLLEVLQYEGYRIHSLKWIIKPSSSSSHHSSRRRLETKLEEFSSNGAMALESIRTLFAKYLKKLSDLEIVYNANGNSKESNDTDFYIHALKEYVIAEVTKTVLHHGAHIHFTTDITKFYSIMELVQFASTLSNHSKPETSRWKINDVIQEWMVQQARKSHQQHLHNHSQQCTTCSRHKSRHDHEHVHDDGHLQLGFEISNGTVSLKASGIVTSTEEVSWPEGNVMKSLCLSPSFASHQCLPISPPKRLQTFGIENASDFFSTTVPSETSFSLFQAYLTNIRELHLQNLTVSTTSIAATLAKQLSTHIAQNQHLRLLDVSNNTFPSSALTTIITEGIAASKSISTLVMNHIDLAPVVTDLISTLQSQSHLIKRLEVRRAKLLPRALISLLKSFVFLTDIASKKSVLEELDLSENFFDASVGVTIGQSFKQCREMQHKLNLKRLYLAGGGPELGDDGCASLLEGFIELNDLSSLEVLDLAHQKCGMNTTAMLNRYFIQVNSDVTSTRLKWLGLAFNNIYDESILRLLKNVPSLSSRQKKISGSSSTKCRKELTCINLSGNDCSASVIDSFSSNAEKLGIFVLYGKTA